MRPKPSPLLANPVAQSLQVLNRDAERLLAIFRGRSAIRSAVWDGDALPDGASLSIALAEGSSLSVLLTCARCYERGEVEGSVSFSAGPGLSAELANSADWVVTRPNTVGSIGMWVSQALEGLGAAGREIGIRGGTAAWIFRRCIGGFGLQYVSKRRRREDWW